jgi:hypothetical protein
MLRFYGREERTEDLRRWYNGYHFGKAQVYNPWSSINGMVDVLVNKDAFLQAYWANTSSNDIVKTLVELADEDTKREIESLLDGKVIEKPIHEEVTYGELREPGDNLWNFLFFTGYLTSEGSRGEDDINYVSMKIPNAEIKYIYKNVIMNWFNRKLKQSDLSAFHSALIGGDAQAVERELSAVLMQTISYHDYSESYYHGFFLGLVRSIKGWYPESNRESGLGRPDIIIKPGYIDKPVYIIELKVADSALSLEGKCDEALEQIVSQKYEEGLRAERYNKFIHYGIAFYKKGCMVKKRG